MLTRAVPVVVVAAAAFVAGAVVAASPAAPAAQRFLDAWEQGDTEAMYNELTPAAREDFSLERFTRAYEDAAMTATITSVSAGEVNEQGDAAVAPIQFQTNIFGELGGDLQPADQRRPGRLDTEPRLPRTDRRRAPQPPDPGAAARRDPRHRSLAALRGPGRGPHRRHRGPGGRGRGRYPEPRPGARALVRAFPPAP